MRVRLDHISYDVMSTRAGGMGRVWMLQQSYDEPRDSVYQRRVAAKTFDFISDASSIEQELNAWIALESPYILPLLTIGRLNYRIAAVMPLLDCSLDDLIDERGSFSESETKNVIADVTRGLSYAWSKHGLLHLDLKPSNILVERRDDVTIRIADWGIARFGPPPTQNFLKLLGQGGGVSHSKTAYGIGTPLYMAPERFSGNWSLSPSADIYSLGMTAIKMATGVLPFRIKEADPIQEIFGGTYFLNAAELLSGHSKHFRSFCLACIHPDPSQRPRTFDAALKIATS